MDSTSISELQETLSLSLSAISLQKKHENFDNDSSISSVSSSSPSISEQYPPPLTSDLHGIQLDLYRWAKYSQYKPKTDEEGRLRAVYIFQYFANAAKASSMTHLTCVSLIQEALDACSQGITAGEKSIKVSQAAKIAPKLLQNAPRLDYEKQGILLKNIPIFNVLEAMCWIYTSCIDNEAIRSERQAELYLYQLYLIFIALKNTLWVKQLILLSTIAAAWNNPGKDSPLLVAFACAGAGKEKVTRQAISSARRDFVKRLHNLSGFDYNEEQANSPGNCPEFLLWGTICKKGSSYRSLCLNLNNYRSYKFCNHCQLVAKSAEQHIQIHIEDWYNKTSLVSINASILKSNGFQTCELKTLGEILMEERKATKSKNVLKERNFITSRRTIEGNIL